MKTLLLLLLPAFAAAQEEATWHVALRGGMHILEDQAFDFVAEDALLGASELSLDRHVWGPLWVGAAWRAAATGDTTYRDLTTTWTSNEVRVAAQARLRVAEPLVAFGRLGAAVSFVDLELATGGRTLVAEDWTPGAIAGLGVEFFPIHRSLISDLESDFGFGLSFEATYARYAPLDLEARTTRLGRYDPSGPGWLIGLALQW